MSMFLIDDVVSYYDNRDRSQSTRTRSSAQFIISGPLYSRDSIMFPLPGSFGSEHGGGRPSRSFFAHALLYSPSSFFAHALRPPAPDGVVGAEFFLRTVSEQDSSLRPHLESSASGAAGAAHAIRTKAVSHDAIAASEISFLGEVTNERLGEVTNDRLLRSTRDAGDDLGDQDDDVKLTPSGALPLRHRHPTPDGPPPPSSKKSGQEDRKSSAGKSTGGEDAGAKLEGDANRGSPEAEQEQPPPEKVPLVSDAGLGEAPATSQDTGPEGVAAIKDRRESMVDHAAALSSAAEDKTYKHTGRNSFPKFGLILREIKPPSRHRWRHIF